MRKRSAYLAGVFLLYGCADFDEPKAVDPAPVVGCYVAPDAPALSVEQAGVRIGQSTEILPYQYQQRKVGMILIMPMVATVREGEFQIGGGEEHFYRVIWNDGRPIIRIAFGPNGIIREYKRRSQNPC